MLVPLLLAYIGGKLTFSDMQLGQTQMMLVFYIEITGLIGGVLLFRLVATSLDQFGNALENVFVGPGVVWGPGCRVGDDPRLLAHSPVP